MFSNSPDKILDVQGVWYKKQVILADVNIPYKFSLDRCNNKLHFCINADEFSDQSFHSVELDLSTGAASIISGFRNGFASAIDHEKGTIYLGGSDGIFTYCRRTKTVDIPAIVEGIDVFDMFYKNVLYFVNTGTQNLYSYNKGKTILVPHVEEYHIHHFVIDSYGDLIFANSSGLYIWFKDTNRIILCEDSELNYRGATTNIHGECYLIAQDGIYSLDKDNRQLIKVLPIENGYGLAFDKNNHIVYSEERLVAILNPLNDN